MKTVAFVPIKMYSQRLPNKNILDLGGRPLCWHVVNALLKVKGPEAVYVYCSDDGIQKHIPKEAVFLKRSPHLDGDFVKGPEIYDAFIKDVEADVYVLAHATSPFLRPATIQAALEKVAKGPHDSAFAARRVQTFAWFNGAPINYVPQDVPRTQDIAPVFVETSGFYVFRRGVFAEHRRRVGFLPYIAEVGAIEGIDIDTADEYELALCVAAAIGMEG